jgi:hypothetical protein
LLSIFNQRDALNQSIERYYVRDNAVRCCGASPNVVGIGQVRL